MLVPKEAPVQTETQTVAQPEPTPVAAPQPVEQPTQAPEPVAEPIAEAGDKGFDKQVSMGKGIDVMDEMRDMTGEDPNQAWKPLIDIVPPDAEPVSTEKPKENTEPTVEPQPATEPQPDKGGKIKAGGKEFDNIDKLKDSYADLQRDYHKKIREFKQEQMSVEARTAKLDNERIHLEKLLSANVAMAANDGQKIEATKPENLNSVSQEEFNEMLDGERGYEAVNKVIESRLAGLQAEQNKNVEQINKSRAENDAKIDQNTMNRNVESMEERFDSFKDNRSKFGEWCKRKFGDDEAGHAVVDRIVLDNGRLEDTYQTYLKDTIDFSTVVQEAKAEGQAVASVKETLQPIQKSSNIESPIYEETDTKKPAPADTEMLDMEKNLFMHDNKGSYFGQKGGGFFR